MSLASLASPSQADPIPGGWHQVFLALQVTLIVSYSSISQPLPPCRYPCLQPCPSLWTSAPPWHLQAEDYSQGLGCAQSWVWDDLSMLSLWGQPCHPAPASVTPGDTWGNVVSCEQTRDICMLATGCVGTCGTEVDRGFPWGWTLLRVPCAWAVTAHLGMQGNCRIPG